MKVSATLLGAKDQLGRQTVYIRVAYPGNKRKHFATGVKVEPRYWNKKVVGHPNAKSLNDQIKSLILKYEIDIPEKSSISFYRYAMDQISKWEKIKKPETIRQLTSGVKKFREFSDIKLSALTSSVLEKYVQYCYARKDSGNTVWKSLKNVRTITVKALKDGLITTNPFLSFDMPRYKDPAKSFLTRGQVDQLWKVVKKQKDPSLKLAGGWFLIGCFTGLRFGDMAKFSRSMIRDGRLIVYTSKTGQIVSMPVNEKLKELFSFISYKPLSFVNVHANRLLKSLLSEAELPPGSFHQSRHTFGTLCASAGISQEVTAKLMGHSNLKTTQIYYQITGTRIDKELEKIF